MGLIKAALGAAGGVMGKGLICLKAILKYRHGSLPQSKLSRELAQASRNHEVPWINNNAQPSRVFLKKSRVNPCQNKRSVFSVLKI